jgi:AcrR family transcriptional regulator
MTKSKWTQKEVDRRFEELLGDPNDDSAAARKRRRILRAAHELFLKQGYRKTSIDDIARKSEVAKGTVYLYFENKGQILIHAIGLEKASLRTRIRPLFDGSLKKGERLELWLVMALTAARDLPLTARLLTGDAELFAALEDIGAKELATRTSEGADFVMELIEEAAPGRLSDAEKRARADVLIGVAFVAGKLLDERIRGAQTVDEFAKTFADIVLHGVGGPRKGK